VLCEPQGRTRKEAAGLLKIPEGTLSSRLATARKTLARRLGDRSSFLDVGMVAPSKVPAPLMVSTIKTGLSLVAGGEAAGVASGNAILLSQGVMKAMLMMKLKSVVTAIVVVARWALAWASTAIKCWRLAGHGGARSNKQLLLNRNRQVNYSPGK